MYFKQIFNDLFPIPGNDRSEILILQMNILIPLFVERVKFTHISGSSLSLSLS